MIRRTAVLATLIAAMAAAGCGGGSSSSTPPVSVSEAKYLYAVNSGDATISGFSIAPSGALTPVPGGSVATSLDTPTGLATGSSGRVYAGSSTSRDIDTFSVNLATGQLSSRTGLPSKFVINIPSTSNAAHLSICGTHLFAIGETLLRSGSVLWGGFAYPLMSDGSIGTSDDWMGFGGGTSFGEGSPEPILSNGVMDQTCRYVFHADTGYNSAEQIEIDFANHRVAGYAGAPTGTAPVWVDADPNFKFLFVANSGSNDVSVLSINTTSGSLTPVSGAPFLSGVQPSSLLVVQSSLYVTNAGDNTVSAFNWDQGTGALTPVHGSPFMVGNKPEALVTAGTDLAHSPTGTLLYVANQNSNNISAFVVESDGALTPVAGSPFAVGIGPKGMAVLVGPQ